MVKQEGRFTYQKTMQLTNKMSLEPSIPSDADLLVRAFFSSNSTILCQEMVSSMHKPK
uniref:Uncharacterized protein n=1 Tax=Arundo donax TaxID=35708 RepID=A0A0A9AYG4_ARUDO